MGALCHQLGRCGFECLGKVEKRYHCGVPTAAFQVRDVLLRKPRHLSKALLRHPARNTQLAYVFSDQSAHVHET